MDVWGAILVLIRRFYLTVPIAALTLFGGYAYAHKVAPEYHASSSVVILGPTAATTNDKNAPPPPANPYATMNLSTLLTTLQIDATNQQTLSAIRAAGGTTNFTMGTVNKSSVVAITATSTSAKQAMTTAGELINLLRADLLNRQKPYTTQQVYQVTAQVIGTPTLQAPDTKSRTRGEAIALGAAIAFTIIIVLVIDAVLANRARGRRRHQPLTQDALFDDTGQPRTTVVRS